METSFTVGFVTKSELEDVLHIAKKQESIHDKIQFQLIKITLHNWSKVGLYMTYISNEGKLTHTSVDIQAVSELGVEKSLHDRIGHSFRIGVSELENIVNEIQDDGWVELVYDDFNRKIDVVKHIDHMYF